MRPVPEDTSTPKEPSPPFAHLLSGATATTPQKSLLTPVKSTAAGQLYYNRQNRTPCAHPANPYLAHLQVASPHLRTPGSGGKFKTPGSGSSRKGTPRFQQHVSGSVYNPFEAALLDHLNSPMVSPNVFKTGPGSCEKTPQTFRWSIDQLASLKPAAIEEMPDHLSGDVLGSHDVEYKAQTAIDHFFQTHVVVPSPWTDSAKKTLKLPRTPGAELESPMCQSSTVPRPGVSKKEVACQTGLTLPVDFDLEKVLGEHYTQPSQKAAPSDEANLSSSSLRRKLFFHGDEGTPLSPVKGSKSRMSEAMDLGGLSPLVSPVKPHTPLRTGQLSPFHTPGSAHFSSSPVNQSSLSSRNMTTPGLRRCSTTSELVHSPQLSPIGASALSDKDCCHSEPTSPRHTHWQGTPGSGCSALVLQLDSPGMSPIIDKDGSFVASQGTPQSSHSGSTTGRRRPVLKRVPTPAELQPSQSPRLPSRGPRPASGPVYSDEEDGGQGMDISCHYFTSPRTSQENPILDLKPTFSEIREVHDESTNQGLCLQMDMLSHDTGYQTNSQVTDHTNSLQLHSQDLGFNSNTDPSLHCNLTNTFSQMPLPHELESNMEPAELKQSMTFNPDEADAPAEMSFNEDRIIRKARVLLGKAPDRTPPESSDKPKLIQSIGVPYFPWHTEALTALPNHDGESVSGDNIAKHSTHVLPSVLASQVLKRAEEDFARYCGASDMEAVQCPTTTIGSPTCSS